MQNTEERWVQMMVFISRYLSENIQSIDFEPITTVVGDEVKIAKSGKPGSIKSHNSELGRPKTCTKLPHSDSILAEVSRFGSVYLAHICALDLFVNVLDCMG